MTGLSITFSETPEQHMEPQKPPSNTLTTNNGVNQPIDHSSKTPIYDEGILLKDDVKLAAAAYRFCQRNQMTYDVLCRRAISEFIGFEL